MRRTLRVLGGCAALWALIVVLLFTCGCGLNQQLVKAFEDYHAATSVEYLEYVNRDAALTDEQKQRRYNTVDDAQRAIIAAKTGK